MKAPLMAGALLLLSIGVTMPGNAYAADWNTGKTLAKFCNRKNWSAKNASWTKCMMFVTGIDDGYNDGVTRVANLVAKQHGRGKASDSELDTDMEYCMPDYVTASYMGLVVSDYLVHHPDSLNQYSDVLVIRAFHEEWSCAEDRQLDHKIDQLNQGM